MMFVEFDMPGGQLSGVHPGTGTDCLPLPAAALWSQGCLPARSDGFASLALHSAAFSGLPQAS